MIRNTMADRNLTLLCLNFLHTTTRNLSSERLLEQTSPSPDMMMMKTTTSRAMIEAAEEYYDAAVRSSKNVYTNGPSPTESGLRSTVHPKLDSNEFAVTPSLLFDLAVNCSNFVNEISSSSNYGSSNTSNNSNITDPDATPIPSGVLPPFPGKNVIIPLYTLIFFLSFIGNFLVILTLFKNRRMRTVTNVLLLNLAVSDLLLGVFCMPVTLIGQILRNFIFGHVMCKLIPYFQAVSVSVGVWTLVAISLERYFAICRPLQSRKWQTRSHAYKMIITVWIFALIWNTPIAFFSELQSIRNSGRYKCREIWPNEESEKIFNLVLDFLLLLIPLCIMAMAYSLIVSKLWKGLRSEIRHTRSFHQYGAHGVIPRDNSLELSTHSQYSTYKVNGNAEVQGSSCGPASVRVSTGREGVTSEILTLKGGKGVVVRWKRKDAVEVAEGPSGSGKSTSELYHPHNNCNSHSHSCTNGQLLSTKSQTTSQQQPSRPKVSRAIRSTYTGKSIESKKKVIRMLFVLVAEFFICWSPLHIVNTWYLFDNKTVYNLIGPLGVVLVQLLAYVSSCCNPITYCFLNRKFRQAFLKAFQCSTGKGKSGPPTIGRGSDISGNDSLVYGPQGSTYNKSISMCSGSRAKTKSDRISGSSLSHSKDEETLELQSVGDIFSDLNYYPHTSNTQISQISSSNPTAAVTTVEDTVDCEQYKSESDSDSDITGINVAREKLHEEDEDEDEDFLYRISWKQPSNRNSSRPLHRNCKKNNSKDLLYS